MTNLLDLTDRIAIVTGGGTGIGAATALLLAEHRCDVVVAARTTEELDRTAASIQSATGRRCLPIRTDVKDEQQVVDLVARTVDEFGRVDILVNNAGGTRMGPLKDLPTKRGTPASISTFARRTLPHAKPDATSSRKERGSS